MTNNIYGGYCIDEKIRKRSSSGGMFYVLAEKVIKKGGHVFGATLEINDNTGEVKVYHTECVNLDDLKKIQGSKYMPSSIDNIFEKILQLLESNMEVLFCGTPCQVAGLSSYLGINYNNLILVDFVCHGVPSKKLIQKIKKERYGFTNNKIQNINFRDKRSGWQNYSLSFIMNDGNIDSEIALESNFMKLFLSDMYLKKACYHCKIKGSNRVSDITLGDYWGVERYNDFNNIEIYEGISIIVINTSKGEQLLSSVKDKVKLFDADKSYFLNCNSSYTKAARIPYNIKFFQTKFDTYSSEQLLEQYNNTRFIRNLVDSAKNKLKIDKKKQNFSKALPSHEYCFGCSACKNICPFNAISMEENQWGFEYPVVDRIKCINCNKCLNVCPVIKENS